MKNYLRYILFTSLVLFLLPFLAQLLGEDSHFFLTVFNFFRLHDQLFWIVSSVSGITSGLLLIILTMKEKRANSIVNKASKRDNFWDNNHIKNNCRLVFYSLYDSLLSGRHFEVEHFLTPEFYHEFFSQVPEVEGSISDIVNPIDITDTKIVTSKDHKADHKDEVSVALFGDFIRPVKGVNKAVTTFPVEKKSFQVLCTFKRNGNEWKLNRIEDPVTLFNLLLRRSEFEH